MTRANSSSNPLRTRGERLRASLRKAEPALAAARRYISDHPEELQRALRSALRNRVGIPMPALRWLAKELLKGKLQRLDLDAEPPGVHCDVQLDAMGTPLRASLVLHIDAVHLSEENASLTLRLEHVSLEVPPDAKSPLAALVRSGALDVSRPGDLVAQFPTPPVVSKAYANRIVLDFLREPRIARNPLLPRILGTFAALVRVQAVETRDDHFDIAFQPLPDGFKAAADAVRKHVVRPSIARVLPRSR